MRPAIPTGSRCASPSPGRRVCRGGNGVLDVSLGGPGASGAGGMGRGMEIALTPDETAALERSADAVRDLFRILNE